MPREHSANTQEGWGNVAKQDLLHIYSIVLTKLKSLAALMQRAMKPSNNISETKEQPLIVTV